MKSITSTVWGGGGKIFSCLFAALAASTACATADVPFSAIRLRKAQTDRPEVWKATLAEFAKYREGVDEVWFSTGICFPKMDEHRASAERIAEAANELRAIGILPSLQIQTTIGHGYDLVRYGDNSGFAWQGWVSENGSAAKFVNCMRAPGFIAYITEMASIYAKAMRPYSVWIDDDIRCISHGGPGWGCYCSYCLGEFAKKEGKPRTRKELLKEMKSDRALAARWRAFAFEGEADLVRAIAEAVHAASPETRMCIQQPGRCFPEHRALYEACHAVTGLPVAMRPGSGSYYDHDPRDQIAKAYILATQMEKVGAKVGPMFDRICPEIETCPRSFASRSGRGVLLEGLESLAQGMNAISAFAIDSGYDTPAWYGGEILAPLARNAAMLKRYVAVSDGAERAGYVYAGTPTTALRTSSLPIKAMPHDVKGEAGSSSGGMRLARLVTSEYANAVVKAGKGAVAALFAEDIVLDGEAAKVLFNAGCGAELGLAASPKECPNAFYSLRERFTDAPVNAGLLARETPIYGKPYVLRPVKGATVISEYCSDMNSAVHPGVAAFMYETPKGRRRVVFGQGVFGTSMRVASGDRVLQMHKVADWASHGKSPVLLDTPTRSFIQPRVRKDGTLASVVFVNASIGETWPVKMRLRGVPPGVDKAVWSSFDEEDVVLDVTREGDDAVVTLPRVPGWNGGYVFFPQQS